MSAKVARRETGVGSQNAGVAGVVARHPRFARGTIARGLAAPPGASGEEGSTPIADSQSVAIDRTGGDKSAGLIRGFAVCTVGEALGHDYWCDAITLQQIVTLANAKPSGLKARFTHPGMSADGLGTFLGRARNLSIDGEVVRGDLHFDPSAHATPDGDLAKYAMDLAESDPEAFGSSIVFLHDCIAEEEFQMQNGAEWVEVDDGYERFKVLQGFQSPDPRNAEHYPHVRVSELRACDVVDEPAANPDGLFHIPSETLNQAQSFMAYALGLSSEKPTGELAAQINPERARGFAARFLEEKGLAIGPKENSMSKSTEPGGQATGSQSSALSADEALQKARQEMQAECQKYTAKFGSKGAEWFAAGLTWEQACDKHCEALAAERDTALAAKKEAEEKLAALDRGETTPVDPGKGGGASSYTEIIKARNQKK